MSLSVVPLEPAQPLMSRFSMIPSGHRAMRLKCLAHDGSSPTPRIAFAMDRNHNPKLLHNLPG
jgi:hypothetical protein